ncbi:MAG TPA: P1 family peptidase [Candidatus Limnocylindria bacterium]|nr:P1 family peptidase [Candidatus Limnocylindria bacterium]
MAATGLTLRDVPGLRVGHWTDATAATGCTVVVATGGAVGGVDVRGSAPGTRETDVLRPTALVERIHAVCLAGGSAFGLAAADGVMRWLDERGVGVDTVARRVPIVPAAVIFDCFLGVPDAYPDAAAGYAACDAADDVATPLEGSVGAGTGATVGKLAGPARATKSGVGSAARMLGDGTVVGALAVTNAVGNVVGRDGRILAGARDEDGGFIGADELLGTVSVGELTRFGTNTTLAVVGTDAPLDRSACRKLAELGHDALAIAIRPVHTAYDGDAVFVMSTGDGAPVEPQRLMALGAATVSVLVEAIERSVLTAESRGGVPALGGERQAVSGEEEEYTHGNLRG